MIILTLLKIYWNIFKIQNEVENISTITIFSYTKAYLGSKLFKCRTVMDQTSEGQVRPSISSHLEEHRLLGGPVLSGLMAPCFCSLLQLCFSLLTCRTA